MTRSRGASLVIAATSVRRLLRDRSTLFFVFVFPLLMVLLIGATFAGQQNLRLAVVAEDVGPLGDELVEHFGERDGIVVDRYGSADAAVGAVSRNEAAGAILLPAGYDQALRQQRRVEIRYVSTSAASGPALQWIVQSVIADQAMVLSAAQVVASLGGLTYDDALSVSEATVAVTPGVDVEREQVGVDELAEEFEGLGQFDLGASQQLLLFVFLTSMTAATALIQSREYGVATRMLAAPLTTRDIIAGEAFGRYLVALVQGLYIIVGTIVIFRVEWGFLPAALLVLAAYAVPSAGAGLLIGATMRNQTQAAAVGIGSALGLAAIGGAMVPLEILPDPLRTVAHATPHAWGYDAFADLVRRGGGVVDVLPETGALVAMGLVVLGIAAAALKRTLTDG